jgi:hypothetical protein
MCRTPDDVRFRDCSPGADAVLACGPLCQSALRLTFIAPPQRNGWQYAPVEYRLNVPARHPASSLSRPAIPEAASFAAIGAATDFDSKALRPEHGACLQRAELE